MTIRDLHIGDKVRDKRTGWEFVITGLWINFYDENSYEITCDFEGNESDPWEFEDINDIELVENH